MGQGSQYARIRADLEHAIRSGAVRPGATIPTERELCAQYGVSRATVQRAVSAMAEAGLVTRRRRAGTMVTERATDLLLWTNVAATGPEVEGRHQVLLAETVPAADVDGELAGVEDTEAAHRIRRVKQNPGGEPIAIEEHVIPFRVGPRVMQEDLETFTSMAYFHRLGLPVQRSRMYISPAVVTSEQAQLLRLEAGTPVFSCRRETLLADGTLAEIYDSVLAPHAFQLFVEQSLDPHMTDPETVQPVTNAKGTSA